MSSLRFATRMKWITTEPVVNVTYDSEVRRERQWKELYFLISLIFRIITLRTWERFGSLMKFHSSASLRLTEFRYVRKKIGYFKLLPLLKLMLELLQSSVTVRVEHCIFLCFQDSISVSWTWEPSSTRAGKQQFDKQVAFFLMAWAASAGSTPRTQQKLSCWKPIKGKVFFRLFHWCKPDSQLWGSWHTAVMLYSSSAICCFSAGFFFPPVAFGHLLTLLFSF